MDTLKMVIQIGFATFITVLLALAGIQTWLSSTTVFAIWFFLLILRDALYFTNTCLCVFLILACLFYLYYPYHPLVKKWLGY